MTTNKTIRSAKSLAQELDKCMKSTGSYIITMIYNNFYLFAERVRIRDGFKTELRKELQILGLEITFGKNAVVVHRDCNFNPLEIRLIP